MTAITSALHNCLRSRSSDASAFVADHLPCARLRAGSHVSGYDRKWASVVRRHPLYYLVLALCGNQRRNKLQDIFFRPSQAVWPALTKTRAEIWPHSYALEKDVKWSSIPVQESISMFDFGDFRPGLGPCRA